MIRITLSEIAVEQGSARLPSQTFVETPPVIATAEFGYKKLNFLINNNHSSIGEMR